MAETEPYRPGLDGVIAAETRLSYLDLDREEIVIRGYSLIELARSVGYVDVVGLLLDGSLPTADGRQRLERELAAARALPPEVLQILRLLPDGAHAMDALRTAVSALGSFDPDGEDVGQDANRRRGGRLVGQMPTVVANLHHLRGGGAAAEPSDASYSADFLRMVVGAVPSAADVRAFDQLLIAYVEHEMPNSTFAARVIASTLADMYGAAAGAVASLKGVLHGGANEAVMRLLLEAQTPAGMERVIQQRLARGERIMGFGHRVYMRRPDPRALLMKETLAALVAEKGNAELLATCEAGEAMMQRLKGLYPNLDYYAAPVYHMLGVPIDLFTPIFFASRSAGIAAHVMEQHAANRLFRPRVRYLGPVGLHP